MKNISEQEKTLLRNVHPYMIDLEKDPKDHGIRLILADWCQDNGETQLEAALRWMAENDKYPRHATTVEDTKAWLWWGIRHRANIPAPSIGPWLMSEPDRLPKKIFYALPESEIKDPGFGRDVIIYKGWGEYELAEKALWLAHIGVFASRPAR